MKEQQRSFYKRIASALQGFQLLLVQCSVCVILLLIVLGLRLIGGDLYETVSSLFQQAMVNDTLISAVSDVWDIPAVSAMSTTNERSITAPFEGGTITSRYGNRNGSMHEGIDIAMDEGTPLKAMLDGTVTVAEYDENGYGHYLVVTCSDTEKYLYAHCSELVVELGDVVQAGDVLAYVGNTGRSSGSHLHMEWICNGQTIDPLQILPESTYD